MLEILIQHYPCAANYSEIADQSIDASMSYPFEINLGLRLGQITLEEWLLKLNTFLLSQKSSCVEILPEALGACSNEPTDVFNSIRFQGVHSCSTLSPAATAQGSTPLVSICMTAYNSSSTIQYAIDSVLNQSHDALELLVIDDNSSDDTVDIVKVLAETDQRIKLVSNDVNRGTYYNRNMALDLSSGDYFTTLDSDDLMEPSRLSKQVAMLEDSNQIQAVLCSWISVAMDGRIHFKYVWGGCYMHETVATMMIRKNSVIPKIGYWDNVKCGADSEFLARIKKNFW